MELWGRCEKNEDIRAIGVSLGEFRKSKVKQIALGEDYDMEKTIANAPHKSILRFLKKSKNIKKEVGKS